MYISRFQLANYKSFFEPAALEFTPGFNIISGQNNAGKTALLEALGLYFIGQPHRSIRTVPVRNAMPSQFSLADVSFRMSANELMEFMRESPDTGYVLQKPDLGSPFAHKIGFIDDSPRSAELLMRAVLSATDVLTFNVRFHAMFGQRASPTVLANPSLDLYLAQGSPNNWKAVVFQVGRDGRPYITNSDATTGADIGHQLAPRFQRHVYRFEAERLKVGKSRHGVNTLLAQDASNLPEVLNQLQHNPNRFQDLNDRLKAILPQVKQVSVRPSGPGEVEIVVWCHNPESRREDLVVPLSESGTGIGQVLAVLYVVLTSDRPQTIIIDEPQSFLHPGAARKLIEFLKLHPQHQFVIATHSATIISAANPRTITLAKFDDGESVLQQLDVKAESGIQKTLIELGIRLGDVFGADKILWVEGRTEEKCFPLIVEKLMRLPLVGIEILGIRQTGDLESGDARKVFEIYRNLTKGASLLPPAVAFILDDEGRDEAAKRELSHLSGNLARFLPRRMYENYLLNARAIAETVNLIDNSRPDPLTPDKVSAALEARLNTPKYFRAPLRTLDDRIRNVDAATVLSEIFSEFSETRVTYQKVLHGVALTEWLIKNAPTDLREIVEMLAGVLKTE